MQGQFLCGSWVEDQGRLCHSVKPLVTSILLHTE